MTSDCPPITSDYPPDDVRLTVDWTSADWSSAVRQGGSSTALPHRRLRPSGDRAARAAGAPGRPLSHRQWRGDGL